jgi:Fe/S biogenesis protein NfuA
VLISNDFQPSGWVEVDMSDNMAQAETGAAGGDDAFRQRVQKVFDEQINPAVAMHGGFITLVDVKGKRVFVEMGGGCQGCGAANMTLKAGIEALLIEEIPEVEEVIDTTDHSHGDNPYFE